MDNIRQKKWLPITVYVVGSVLFLGLLLLFAETYFPSQSSDLVPARPDRVSRWVFNIPTWRIPASSDSTAAAARRQKLLLPLHKKMRHGNAELVYRGLAGESEFQIDVIIPDLDPQVSYSYRFKIADARKSFRLVDHDFKIISARKHSLQMMQLGE
ncbi:MAG: hypothetical protein JSW26_18075 [Desulfobacterales bacterium]|nr:MAG: hypothetical protein JSW26_18075 [Desulfobacterales bacterium]